MTKYTWNFFVYMHQVFQPISHQIYTSVILFLYMQQYLIYWPSFPSSIVHIFHFIFFPLQVFCSKILDIYLLLYEQVKQIFYYILFQVFNIFLNKYYSKYYTKYLITYVFECILHIAQLLLVEKQDYFLPSIFQIFHAFIPN